VERFNVGVDVSAKTLDVAFRVERGRIVCQEFNNDNVGHRALVKYLKKRSKRIRLVMESTGVYGLDLAIALHKTGIELMVANPRATANFAKANLQRSKTDRLDAGMLLLFAESMPFVQWHAPSAKQLELRSISRRVQAVLETVRAEKSRMHAAMHVEGTTVVRKSIKASLKGLAKQIAELRVVAGKIIASDPVLARRNELLLTIKGVGEISAFSILAELCVLPADMTDRQWVAHAGLDPREVESGTSVRLPPRISKRGNVYLRAVLYLPARVASRWEPSAAAFGRRLKANGKKPLQIHVAVMRKLLHAINAMFRNDEAFDGRRLFPSAAVDAVGTSGIAPLAISEVSMALQS
jgi:transposase